MHINEDLVFHLAHTYTNEMGFQDEAVRKFESLSGAILSRNKKCQIIGFGSWEDRSIWPINYLKTVKEIKVFGVFIMNSYNDLLKRNWSYRFEKFEQSILSWSPRVL